LPGKLEFTGQSVNDLLGHLEERGYLAGEPDPAGGRARVVRLTATGRRLEKTVSREARSAEGRIAGLPGPRRFTQMRDALESLAGRITRNDLPSPRPG
jgi:DNA-binding MarR family transcriptional regulator